MVKRTHHEVARAGDRSQGRLQPRGSNTAVARGAGATLHPGEAVIRRLKLVAAPARSQSEPDPGGHASVEGATRVPHVTRTLGP